jgi:hypothetical protein
MRGLGAARGQAGRDRLVRLPAGVPATPPPAPVPAAAGQPPRRFRRAPMIVDEPKTISEEALWGTPPPDPAPVRRLSPPTQVKFRRAV